jgi:hypothetical protein
MEGLMMNGKLLYTVALAGLFTISAAMGGGPEVVVVEPDYFSGFFVGGTGAFHMAGFNGNSSTATSTPVIVEQTIIGQFATATIDQVLFPAGTLTSNGFAGNSYDGYYGAQAGIGKVFNHRWYAGIVGFGEWGNQNSGSNSNPNFTTNSNVTIQVLNLPPVIVNVPVSTSYYSNTTVKLSNNYGVAFKPGFLVAPRSMVYGKIGATWANLKVYNTFNGYSDAQLEVSRAGMNRTFENTASLSGSSSN